MRYQIFAPLVALQAVNLFWYWNIWRIIITYAHSPSLACSYLFYLVSTIVFKKDLDDDRSEHGDDDTKEKED